MSGYSIDWVIMRNSFITAAHNPGIMNVGANAESRSSETRTEWKLNESDFHSISNHFRSNTSVDLFTSWINSQLARFFMHQPDRNAGVIDAFTVNLHTIDFYRLTQFFCFRKRKEKIILDKASGMLIEPNWSNQYWYDLLVE